MTILNGIPGFDTLPGTALGALPVRGTVPGTLMAGFLSQMGEIFRQVRLPSRALSRPASRLS